MRNTVVEDTSPRKILVRPENLNKLKSCCTGGLSIWRLKLQGRQVSEASVVVAMIFTLCRLYLFIHFIFEADIY